MTALLKIDATSGIQFREHPTQIDTWLVDIDGKDTRSITKDGASFIAWLGGQDRHWCFSRALKACAEHARFHRAEHERATAEYEARREALRAKTPEARRALIAALEAEQDDLKWKPSGVDVAARSAEIDRRIALVRGL